MYKISVVIPVCNRQDELIKSILSVSRQTYSDLEILVIENNSVNPKKIRKAVELIEDDRVQFHSLVDCSNANVARNFGMDHATGDYITFLDSDDEYYPEHLEQIISLIGNLRPEFVYGSIDIWDGYKLQKAAARDIMMGEGPLEYLFGKNGGSSQTNTYVIERSCVDKIRWDETLKRHQDFDFFIQAALKLKIACNYNSASKVNWIRGDERNHDGDSLVLFYKKWSDKMPTDIKIRFSIGKIKRAIRKRDVKLFSFFVFNFFTVVFFKFFSKS